MTSIKLNRRTIRRIVCAASLCLFACGVVGCGGGNGANPDYRTICEAEKECMPQEDFQQLYGGSVQSCIDLIETYAQEGSQACQDAKQASLKCEAQNIQCMGDVTTVDGACDLEFDEVDQTCGGPA